LPRARSGATLGLGAISAVGVGVWQGIDTVRSSIAHQRDSERAALKEIADLWGKLPSRGADAEPQALGALASALARTSDTFVAPTNEEGWFNRSDLAVQILAQTRASCQSLAASAPPACRYLLALSDA
jgi:hypothetical protein